MRVVFIPAEKLILSTKETTALLSEHKVLSATMFADHLYAHSGIHEELYKVNIKIRRIHDWCLERDDLKDADTIAKPPLVKTEDYCFVFLHDQITEKLDIDEFKKIITTQAKYQYFLKHFGEKLYGIALNKPTYAQQVISWLATYNESHAAPVKNYVVLGPVSEFIDKNGPKGFKATDEIVHHIFPCYLPGDTDKYRDKRIHPRDFISHLFLDDPSGELTPYYRSDLSLILDAQGSPEEVKGIALDIDGVCIDQAGSRRFGDKEEREERKERIIIKETESEKERSRRIKKRQIGRRIRYLDRVKYFSQKAIDNLKLLFKENPGLKIIISSDWRYNPLNVWHFRKLFKQFGLGKYIISTTQCRGHGERGQEILDWRNSYGKVLVSDEEKSFPLIAIDDNIDGMAEKIGINSTIRCNPEFGFVNPPPFEERAAPQTSPAPKRAKTSRIRIVQQALITLAGDRSERDFCYSSKGGKICRVPKTPLHEAEEDLIREEQKKHLSMPGNTSCTMM